MNEPEIIELQAEPPGEGVAENSAVTEGTGKKITVGPKGAKAKGVRPKNPKKKAVKTKSALKKKTGASLQAGNQFDLGDSQWYLNRELTWLEFNRRVLHEAEDERTPLLERLKFLAIVSGNLDEFFMKRIGGLKQQIGAGVHELTLDGRTPRQQVQECHTVIRDINARKMDAFSALRALLEHKGIAIEQYDSLTAKEKKELRENYYANI
ncbi:MAG TPA: RNA degradosome polyphosphate kinase, partial [Geobacteraceae bacterium]|nr:RNA degradosome polyphosphate kinase [Geobacteraceae bacterium]